MGYRMKTLKTITYYASNNGLDFTNSAQANQVTSTGIGIGTPDLIPTFAGTGSNGPCSGQDSNIAEIDVQGASAGGIIYIYWTPGPIPAGGMPPNSGDVVMAEINYGTGTFTYKASWKMPCSKGQGFLYIATSSGTADSTINIVQFRVTVLINLFTLKA